MHVLYPGIVAALALVSADEEPYQTVPTQECGPLCLQVCGVLSGEETTRQDVSRLIRAGPQGTTLADLERAAGQLGLATVAVQWSDEVPDSIAAPAIIPVTLPGDRRHFLTLVGYRNGKALVIDAPSGVYWIDTVELRERLGWNGAALHIARDPAELADVRAAVRYPQTYLWAGMAATGVILIAVAISRRRRASPL